MSTNININANFIVNPYVQNQITLTDDKVEILEFKYVLNGLLNSKIQNYSQFNIVARIDRKNLSNLSDAMLLIKLNLDFADKNYQMILAPISVDIISTSFFDKIIVNILGIGYFSWRLIQENNLKLLFSSGFSNSGVLPTNIEFNKNLFLFLKQTIAGFLKAFYGDFQFNFLNDKETQATTVLENIILPEAKNNYEIIKNYLLHYNPILGFPLFWIDDMITMTINFDELITAAKNKGLRIQYTNSNMLSFSINKLVKDGISVLDNFKKLKANYIIKNFNNVQLIKNKEKSPVFIYKNNKTIDTFFVENLFIREIPYTINNIDLENLKKFSKIMYNNVNLNAYLIDINILDDLEKYQIGSIIKIQDNAKKNLEYFYIVGTETKFSLGTLTNKPGEEFNNKFNVKRTLKAISITDIKF